MIDFYYQVVTPAWSTRVVTTARVCMSGRPTNVTVRKGLKDNTVRQVSNIIHSKYVQVVIIKLFHKLIL